MPRNLPIATGSPGQGRKARMDIEWGKSGYGAVIDPNFYLVRIAGHFDTFSRWIAGRACITKVWTASSWRLVDHWSGIGCCYSYDAVRGATS
jgi:hypothetical protein